MEKDINNWIANKRFWSRLFLESHWRSGGDRRDPQDQDRLHGGWVRPPSIFERSNRKFAPVKLAMLLI